jgi:hypothetical protein
MATTKNKKGKIGNVMEVAADAAVELGAAAQSLREGWDHVQKARRRAQPAARAVKKVTRSAAKAIRTGVKRVTGGPRPVATKKKAATKKRR